ncbi:MAG TPA: glycosyltransferase family 4 protein [Verrucomicrobiae bacterium]|jgi:glycosyltransferase involved in cell wall biosynthesis
MKMWIIQVGEQLPQLDKTTRQLRCALLTDQLLASGHKVVRWGPTFSHIDKVHRFQNDTTRRFGENLEIRLLHGPGYRFHRSPQRLLHHRTEAASFRRQAEKCERPDLIFCCLPTSHLCRSAVDYGRRHKVPVVVDVRDLWPDHYLTIFPSPLRRWIKPILTFEYRSLRRFLSGAAGITAISEAFLKWGLRHAGRNRRQTDGMFPHGYPSQPLNSIETSDLEAAKDDLRGRLNVRKEDFTVVFAGTFVSSFDFETVISAARRLEERGHRMRFLLAGTGGYEQRTRRLAEGMKSVTFLGWIQNKQELGALLQLADAGLGPYRSDCTMSLPNKPFEYMAAGLPQVSSLEGEMAEIIEREQVGLQYKSNNVDGLCQCLIQLAENRPAAQGLGKNARRLFLRSYSAEVIYRDLLEHLLRVADVNSLETS